MIRILLFLLSYMTCTGLDPFSHGLLPQSNGKPNTCVLPLDTLRFAELLQTFQLQTVRLLPKKLMLRLTLKPPPQSLPHSPWVVSKSSLPCSALPLPHLCAAALAGLFCLCFCFCSFLLFFLCWPCWPK